MAKREFVFLVFSKKNAPSKIQIVLEFIAYSPDFVKDSVILRIIWI